MSLAVVRVLWGDGSVPRGRWSRVWHRNVLPRLAERERVAQHVYVYGAESAEMLVGAGVPTALVHLCDDAPYPDWRDHRDAARHHSVLRPWRYKLELVRCALLDHGEVVYADWDVRCLLSSVRQAADLLEGSTHFSLFKYKRRQQVQLSATRKGLTVSGRWMHLKGTRRINEALRIMDEQGWWHDEWALTEMMRRRWRGEANWLRHYESPMMVQREPWTPWTRRGRRTEGRGAARHVVIERNTPAAFVWHKLFDGTIS